MSWCVSFHTAELSSKCEYMRALRMCCRPFFAWKLANNQIDCLSCQCLNMYVLFAATLVRLNQFRVIYRIRFEKSKWRSKWNDWEQLHSKINAANENKWLFVKAKLCSYQIGKSSRVNKKYTFFIMNCSLKSKAISYHQRFLWNFVRRVVRGRECKAKIPPKSYN